MKQFHTFTNVTAGAVLFGVALIGALSMPTKSTFRSPQFKSDEMPVELAPVQETDSISIGDKLSNSMTLVFNIGREVGDPETLQAILLQETNGGRSELIGNKSSPVGKRSYGLMQVQVVAARSVLERFPKLVDTYFPDRKYKSIADEEIIALLLTDDEANATIAAYHFKLYKSLSNGNWDLTVAGYNAGIGAALHMLAPSEFGYVKDIKQKISTIVRPFNKQHKLQLTQRF